ncbi:sulfur carrier protein ThiS [Pigmentiphaga sp.]|jgi:thiamine biosynthesis protein ThiS|uniref:sulfur carrier protein ThiS n=1 Tax=Pigmentiphaga sp. TaxID=1977564 RepID=UPI0025FEFDE0|nr:sulfur carrier protein ThiS [Pigmentiphaga sp.]MBX6319753.1 sulfur carrier protein ThiS [Pigmentiphaga sp.]
MNIVLNGESRTIEAPSSVADLIQALGYAGKRVAVERNGEIVPRSAHEHVLLADGDRIEIVVAVGGG